MEKRVLITGASRGIGAETARRFAQSGWTVGIHYNRGEAPARALAEELAGQGHEVRLFRADVGDPRQAEGLIEEALGAFGGLEALVCNAGVAWTGLLGDMTWEEWRGVFGVNVDALFSCCKAVLPHFIHRKAGRIITVSSMWGQVGASCEVAYSASKAAVIGFTRALAKEVAPSGITVNCVAPGVIDTEMNDHLSPEEKEALRLEIPLERLGTPGDVAESILFLAGAGGSYLTGQVLGPNGGLVMA